MVEDPLSEGLLSGKFRSGDKVIADREGGELSLKSDRPEGETDKELTDAVEKALNKETEPTN